MLAGRNTKQVVKALTEKQHYIALFNMVKNYPNFFDNLNRYLTGEGNYPYNILIKTPMGIIAPTIYSYHDMLTVNEVFCRIDYPADKSIKVVVDIGSNIGLSALYFLTQSNQSKCYLFEPDHRNFDKLLKNLCDYKNRYKLVTKAVSNKKGVFDFGIEETGRYGGIGLKNKENIKVDSLNINHVLSEILSVEKSIDILKVDIEGLEEETINSIHGKYLNKIKRIYFESTPKINFFPNNFNQSQYGSVCQLINKILI